MSKKKERKSNTIYGMMFRPVSMNKEDNEEVMSSTDFSVSRDFYREYSKHVAAMQIVAECAKIYIHNNWEKVKDWSGLNVVMEDANTMEGLVNAANGGNPLDDYIEYYNHDKERKFSEDSNKEESDAYKKLKPKKSPTIEKFLKSIDEDNKLRHNPVVSVTKVILDPSDGDFSMEVNGRSHMWLSDSTVIIIAKYVEEQLNENNEQDS